MTLAQNATVRMRESRPHICCVLSHAWEHNVAHLKHLGMTLFT